LVIDLEFDEFGKDVIVKDKVKYKNLDENKKYNDDKNNYRDVHIT
jgi:hypothetical protein